MGAGAFGAFINLSSYKKPLLIYIKIFYKEKTAEYEVSESGILAHRLLREHTLERRL
jgi:hypothetical protein